MANKSHMWLCAGICLLTLTSQAPAQDEQWLQYHLDRQAQRIVGDMGTSTLDITAQKPQGVELPEFKTQEPFFAQWSTPMVKSGQLRIALDRANKRGRWDRLFIDSNGDGRLSDEKAVKAYRTEQYYTYFGPVKVVFQVEDGPVTYHLNFQFYNYDGKNRRLHVSSGCWYEGTITVAGAKKHCVLIDQNVNGTFDDKAIEANRCDRIRIGNKDGRDARFVGNFIEIDGVLYKPEIARDGAYIKLTRAEDVKTGTIRLPESVTEFSVGGENGLFTFKPKSGIGSLPTGKYRINYWAVERKDDQGRKWKLKGSLFSNGGTFDVAAGAETQLSVGEPIISTVEAQNRKATYSFSHDLKGRLGERIELTRNGSRPRAPKLHITSKDGTYDRTFSFEYG